MGSPLSLLKAIGAGAALMYYYDPRLGKHRRSLLRDQCTKLSTRTSKLLDAASRNLQNRTCGTLSSLRSAIAAGDVTDGVLVARVRSKLGHYVSNPSSIEVIAHDGQVTLSGAVLASEVPKLLAAIGSVSGVCHIENQLQVHESADNITSLHRSKPRQGEFAELMQSQWSPATRVCAGTAGLVLLSKCMRRRGPMSLLLGGLGVSLLTRAAVNIDSQRLLGIAPGPRGIDLTKSITIDAPAEKVYAFLSDKHNFLQVTDKLKSVREVGEGRYEKIVAGPAGVEVKLEETVRLTIPNEELEWESTSNSAVQYAGTARLESLEESKTRVDVCMTYNPPGGIVSHTAAWIAGWDPKTQMDDLCMRVKTFLETGQQPHDATARKVSAESEQTAKQTTQGPAVIG